MNTKLKWILPFALILAGIIAAKMFVQFGNKAQQRPIEIIPPLVEVQPILKGVYRTAETSQGEVDSPTEIDLTTEVRGKLVEVSPALVSGGFFKAGEALARIDASDYETAVDRARAEVARARVAKISQEAEAAVALQEWQSLGENRGEPSDLLLRKPQLAEAEANLQAALANLKKAEKDLERTVLTAPFNGRVRQKYADVGQFLRDADRVARIYSVEAAEVRLPLPIEKTRFLDLPLDYTNADLKTEHPVHLSATFGGQEFTWEARLDRVEGEVDPRTRMIYLVARVDQPYALDPAHPNRPPLAVGMFVNAQILGQEIQDSVELPRQVMHDRDTVLVVSPSSEENQYHQISIRSVEVIQRNESTIVIREGLNTGEKICVSPLSIVTEGMLVRLESDAQTSGK